MTVTVTHTKHNNVPNWTQPVLDNYIATGVAPLPPVGTVLNDITLPQDWNANHTIVGNLAETVSNLDGSLTISPTSGAVVASLNVAHANTWTGKQTFQKTTTQTRTAYDSQNWLDTTVTSQGDINYQINSSSLHDHNITLSANDTGDLYLNFLTDANVEQGITFGNQSTQIASLTFNPGVDGVHLNSSSDISISSSGITFIDGISTTLTGDSVTVSGLAGDLNMSGSTVYIGGGTLGVPDIIHLNCFDHVSIYPFDTNGNPVNFYSNSGGVQFNHNHIWMNDTSGTGGGSIHMEGGDIVSDATNGSRIFTTASEKGAFFGSTPIAQPSGNLLTAMQNLGLITSATLTSTNVGLGNVTNDAQIKAANFPSSSVNNEVVLFSGTGGKTVQRASSTGIAKLASGVLSTVTAPSGAILGDTDTQTQTNKRITPRIGTTTSSATPTINTDNVDQYLLTAQTADITSFTTNLSGTPTNGQKLIISITGTAARAITWGTSFEASTTALPTTTVTTARLDVGFIWNAATSKWRCLAVA